jgi:hypothetical protein
MAAGGNDKNRGMTVKLFHPVFIRRLRRFSQIKKTFYLGLIGDCFACVICGSI